MTLDFSENEVALILKLLRAEAERKHVWSKTAHSNVRRSVYLAERDTAIALFHRLAPPAS